MPGTLPTQATSEHCFVAGTVVSFSTNLLAPSYTAITDVKSVTPQGGEAGESDDTQLASTGQTKESSPGWITPQDLEILAFLVQAQDIALFAIFAARAKALWKIAYPPLSTQTTGLLVVATGWIKTYKAGQGSTGSDDKYATTWTVHVSGVTAYTPGA